MNSLNPKITMAAIAHGGGNQLLFLLLASWKMNKRKSEVIKNKVQNFK